MKPSLAMAAVWVTVGLVAACSDGGSEQPSTEPGASVARTAVTPSTTSTGLTTPWLMRPVWHSPIRIESGGHHGFLGQYLVTTHQPGFIVGVTSVTTLDGWDVATGRQIWSRRLQAKGYLTVGTWRTFEENVLVPVAGNFVTLNPRTGQPTSGGRPVEISAATEPNEMATAVERRDQSGRLLWRTASTDRCPVRALGNGFSTGGDVPDADDDVVAMVSSCDSDTGEVSLVDASSGRVLWKNKINPGSGPENNGLRLQQHHHFVVVTGDNFLAVYNRAGKLLHTRHAANICSSLNCVAIEVNDRLVVTTITESFGVDGTGRLLWSLPETLGRIGGSGEYAYFWTKDDDDQIPGVLNIIDPADGRRTVVSMPIDYRAIDWLSYRDGMIYVISHPPTTEATNDPPGVLTAYRLTPGSGQPELGGGGVSQWPNACDLLPTAKLERLFGTTYSAAGRTSTYLGVRFPRPITCDWSPRTRGKPLVRVSEAWVSPTAAEAARLFATFAHTPWLLKPIKGLGEAAYAVVSELEPTGGEVYVRSGRFIVHVTSPRNPKAAEQAARIVADRLKEIK